MAIKIQGEVVLDYGGDNSSNTNISVGLGAGANLASANNISFTNIHNTAVGHNALRNTYDPLNGGNATENTAVGAYALYYNSTGFYNTAVGSEALLKNTTGYNNTAVGAHTLHENTIGILNTAVGKDALFNNTTGSENTAVGASALTNNTTGYYNTAVGFRALVTNTEGYENTGIGVDALRFLQTGFYNTAVGTSALALLTTGYENTAVGTSALLRSTTGIYNTAVGTSALQENVTGIKNTAVGTFSLYFSPAGNDNTGIGYQALLQVRGNKNIGIGSDSANAIYFGSNNVVLGSYSGAAAPISGNGNNWIVFSDGFGTVRQVIDPSGNVGIGKTSAQFRLDVNGAINANTSFNILSEKILYYGGDNSSNTNLAIGPYALANIVNSGANVGVAFDPGSTYGSWVNQENIGIGYRAGANLNGHIEPVSGFGTNGPGSYNTIVGSNSAPEMYAGNENVGVGSYALHRFREGFLNTAIGASALAEFLNGHYNTSIGANSLSQNRIGRYNTALGTFALAGNITGNNNIGLGGNAGGNIQHGSNNVILGKYTGASAPISGNGNNWIVIADGFGTVRQVIDPSGNVSIGATSTNYKLEVAGSFAAQTKSFVISHPTKEGMMLRYGSLEGPENGVYVRGKIEGKSIIELPEYWWNLIDEETITVNLTPYGRAQEIWVQSTSSHFIHLNQPADCFFTVFAERKDVDKLIVEY